MVINHLERHFVTSDASTLMNELDVEHPAAKLIVLAARAQEQEIGDGTNFVRTATRQTCLEEFAGPKLTCTPPCTGGVLCWAAAGMCRGIAIRRPSYLRGGTRLQPSRREGMSLMSLQNCKVNVTSVHQRLFAGHHLH